MTHKTQQANYTPISTQKTAVYVDGGDLNDAFALAVALRELLTAVGFDRVDPPTPMGRI